MIGLIQTPQMQSFLGVDLAESIVQGFDRAGDRAQLSPRNRVRASIISRDIGTTLRIWRARAQTATCTALTLGTQSHANLRSATKVSGRPLLNGFQLHDRYNRTYSC